MESIRVAAVSINSPLGDVAGVLDGLDDWTRKAVEDGAELVVFPELQIHGHCTPNTWELAEAIPDGQSTRRVEQIAIEKAHAFGEAAFAGAFTGQGGKVRLRLQAGNANAFDSRRQRQRRRPRAGAHVKHTVAGYRRHCGGQQDRIDGGAVASGRLDDRHPSAEKPVFGGFRQGFSRGFHRPGFPRPRPESAGPSPDCGFRP